MIDLDVWIAVQVLKKVSYDLFGKEPVPANKAEARELKDRISSVLKRTSILTFKPKNWKDDPHPKQGWFVRSHVAQTRAFIAANQVGKTWAVGAELIAWCLGRYPWSNEPYVFPGGRKWQPGMRFGLGGKDFINSLSEDIIPKMNQLLPLREIGCEFEKIQGRVISKISFPAPFYTSIKLMSYEMEPSKWEGYTWDGFAFNEPPPRHAYVATARGMMKNGAPTIFAMTPIEEPYIYEEIYSSPKAIHINCEADLKKLTQDSIAIVTCDLADTPYMSDEQKAIFASKLDEDEVEARLHGRFLHLMGRVYKNFDREKHAISADEFFVNHPEWRKYPAFCVVDPHDRKPFAMAWGVVTPRDEKVFIAEWPDFDFTKIKSYKATIDEYTSIIRDLETRLWKTNTEGGVYGLPDKDAPIMWRILDPNFGRSPKAGGGRSVEEEFADRGLFFDTTVDDDVASGHIVVRNAFASQQLFFLDTCKNLIKSAENYTWDEYRGRTDHSPKEKPRDKFKDFMDLVRYVIKTGVAYFTPYQRLEGMIPRGHENGGMGRWGRR